jgi:hypothetical protein
MRTKYDIYVFIVAVGMHLTNLEKHVK